MGSLRSLTGRIAGVAGRGLTGLLTLVAFLVLGRADQVAASSIPSSQPNIGARQDQTGDLQLSYVQVGDVGQDGTLPPPRME